MFRNLIIVVLTTALAACESYYRVPDSANQPTAKIRFKSSGPDQHVMVAAYDSEECARGPASGVLGTVGGIRHDPLGVAPDGIKSSGNTLNMIGYNDKEPLKPIERVVLADKPFVFTFFRIIVSGPVVRSCNATRLFTPKDKSQYEAVYMEDKLGCTVNVYRLEQSGSTVRRILEPLKKNKKVCTQM